jgi:hypothetical protein
MLRSGPSAGEGVAQGGGVADVGLDEGETGTGHDGLEGGQVTGRGKLVRHADMCPTPGEELARDRRADEAGTAAKAKNSWMRGRIPASI